MMGDIPTPSEEESQKMSEEYQNSQNKSIPIPKIDFAMFAMSLATAAHTYLGNIPDQMSGAMNPDLELAKQHIDILTMLKEKTEGNRTPEESNLLQQLIYELQMAFVEKSRNHRK